MRFLRFLLTLLGLMLPSPSLAQTGCLPTPTTLQQATLSWTAPSPPWAGGTLDTYRVQQRMPAGAWSEIGAPPAGTTTWRVTNLTPGTYEWQVLARYLTPSGPAVLSAPSPQGIPPPCLLVHLPPTVEIVSPTTAETYTSAVVALALSGRASDDGSVATVRWQCPTCTPTSGQAQGTTQWTIASLTLRPGSNTITVLATDNHGATTSDVLQVTFDAGVPTPPGNLTVTPG